MRDIRLRLVIIVIADEVFDRVFGEKLLEFTAKLRGKRFIVRQHKRRTVDARDHICHRESLARSGDAKEHLFVQAVFHPCNELFDRLGLIARGLIGRYQFKRIHSFSLIILNRIIISLCFFILNRSGRIFFGFEQAIRQTVIDTKRHRVLKYKKEKKGYPHHDRNRLGAMDQQYLRRI